MNGRELTNMVQDLRYGLEARGCSEIQVRSQIALFLQQMREFVDSESQLDKLAKSVSNNRMSSLRLAK